MTEETAPAKRRFMSDGEIYKAMGLLTVHLKRTGEGYAYASGWSDQVVAAEVGCSLNNIAGLRERNFGKLVKLPETDPRIDELIGKHNAFVRDVITAIDPKGHLALDTYLMGETK